jgi:hypothetical protein
MLPMWTWALLGLLASIFTFALVYQALPLGAFIQNDGTVVKLSFGQAAMTSVSTQTLLGLGHVFPDNDLSRACTMVQAAMSFAFLIFVTTRGGAAPPASQTAGKKTR